MNLNLKIPGYIFAGLLLFTACNSSDKKESTDGKSTLTIGPLIANKNAERQTMFFRLTDEETTDSTKVYIGKSVYEQDTVALKLEVLTNIPAGITSQGTPDEDNGFIKGAIRISSVGEQSDNFVKSLQSIFNTKGASGAEVMTKDTLLPLVFSSNNRAVDLNNQGTYSFKLFLDNTYGPEAEMFAVLDTYKSTFELSEKDSTFRENILSAFTGE